MERSERHSRQYDALLRGWNRASVYVSRGRGGVPQPSRRDALHMRDDPTLSRASQGAQAAVLHGFVAKNGRVGPHLPTIASDARRDTHIGGITPCGPLPCHTHVKYRTFELSQAYGLPPSYNAFYSIDSKTQANYALVGNRFFFRQVNFQMRWSDRRPIIDPNPAMDAAESSRRRCSLGAVPTPRLIEAADQTCSRPITEKM